MSNLPDPNAPMDPIDRLEIEFQIAAKLEVDVDLFVDQLMDIVIDMIKQKVSTEDSNEKMMTLIRKEFEFVYWLGWGDQFMHYEAENIAKAEEKENESNAAESE